MTPNLNLLLTTVKHPGVYQATCYLSPTEVAKLTRRRFKGKLQPTSTRQETFLLTLGRPNFLERQLIKACQRAKEPFPVRKIQVKVLHA